MTDSDPLPSDPLPDRVPGTVGWLTRNVRVLSAVSFLQDTASELRVLDARMRVVNLAITLCTLCALLICTVVAVMLAALRSEIVGAPEAAAACGT